eukprot:m51a1_g13633 hypothetical protein (293) ;mRNA; r:1029-2050
MDSKDTAFFLDTLKGLNKQFREAVYWFLEPVDEIKHGAPGYFQIIKNPMDLGTIKSKLSGHKYTDPAQAAADFDLVWNNAMTYNHPGSLVHDAAAKMRDYCSRRFAPYLAGAAGQQGQGQQAQAAAQAQPPKSSKSKDRDRERDRDRDKKKKRPQPSPPAPSIAAPPMVPPAVAMQQQQQQQQIAQQMAQQQAAQQQQQAAAQAAQAPATMMSIDEMTELRDAIEKLNEDQLQQVVRIVSEGTANPAPNGEVELELSAMEPSVLRELQRYVNSIFGEPSTKRQRTTEGPSNP